MLVFFGIFTFYKIYWISDNSISNLDKNHRDIKNIFPMMYQFIKKLIHRKSIKLNKTHRINFNKSQKFLVKNAHKNRSENN
ncbi:hypothetical protein BpHYR1_044633 [Brachionus plicatilis]|uniref:Uncharacterized protein n=1 Tax=Brachionus plicatilis TaxID=10195 RepID=A0A3M7RW83_BRAPC|nr:hypothetical protein BpHYR1_044633 [Brachionus plicatilis]